MALSSSRIREVLGHLDGVGAEGGHWVGPVPLPGSSLGLSVWEAERRPRGAVDRGGAKVQRQGSGEGSLFEKPGYTVDRGI